MWHLAKSSVFKTLLGWVMLNHKEDGDSEKEARVEHKKQNLEVNQEKYNKNRLNESMRKQFLAILPVYILQLCYGMSSGYPAITTPQLSLRCAAFQISSGQESWIVSLDNLATPLVCILSGFLQQKFGPKLILMFACFPYMCGWGAAAGAGHIHSVVLLYASRLFVGVGHGFLVTTIYTVEVSSKEFRGSFSIFEGVLRSIGLILVFCFGALIPWYQIAYFAPVFPLMAFLLLLNSPESPVFLVSRGKIVEAEASIGKLKHKDYDIKREIENISFGIAEQKQSHNGEVSKLDILRNINKYPEIYKPFLIVLILSIVQQFSGATVIRGFVVKIFGKVFLKAGDNTFHTHTNATQNCDTEEVPMISRLANLSAILIAVVRLFASLILAKLLVKIPRRSLYAASAVGTVLSLAFFATTLVVSDHAVLWELENSEDLLNWSSVVSACLLVFSVNLGVQPMPLLMSSELFPAEVRALCKGISRSITCMLIILSLKMYPVIEQNIQLYGTFYLYSGTVLLLLPVIYLVLPETRNQSLACINRQFSDNQLDQLDQMDKKENMDIYENSFPPVVSKSQQDFTFRKRSLTTNTENEKSRI